MQTEVYGVQIKCQVRTLQEPVSQDKFSIFTDIEQAILRINRQTWLNPPDEAYAYQITLCSEHSNMKS